MDNQEYLKVSKEIKNYKTARINVIAILAMTLLSFVLYFSSESRFLFSIYTSIVFVAVGKAYPSILGVAVAIAVLILAVYLVFWILSKKHRWAMIVLLVLFSVDCAVLLIDFNVYAIIDIAIHAFMMYYFVLGVKAAANLQKHFPQGVQLTQEQLNEAYRIENGVDPRTGQPVLGPDGQPVMPQNGMPMGANTDPIGFDPMTGAPIYAENKAENAQTPAPIGFDPMTGAPIYAENKAEAPEEKTGESNPTETDEETPET